MMNERLIAAYLPHDDIVFLSKLVTLTNVAPDERGKQHHQKHHGQRK